MFHHDLTLRIDQEHGIKVPLRPLRLDVAPERQVGLYSRIDLPEKVVDLVVDALLESIEKAGS